MTEEIQDVEKELAEALAASADGTVKVTGYRRSDGGVVDLRVRPGRDEDYKALVEKSVAWLYDQMRGGLAFAGHDPEVVRAAAEEQMASWVKSGKGETPKREMKETLERSEVSGVSVWKSAAGLVLLHATGTSEPRDLSEARKVNSAPKTLAKQALVKLSPLGAYIGRLNLYPGKYERILPG